MLIKKLLFILMISTLSISLAFTQSEDISDEELVMNIVTEVLSVRAALCKDDEGKWMIGKVAKAPDNSEINCTELAKLEMYLYGVENEVSDDESFSCLYDSERYEKSEKMEIAKVLNSYDDISINMEQQFGCPGKEESTQDCLDGLVCNSLRTVVKSVFSGPVGGTLLDFAGRTIGESSDNCLSQEGNDCFSEIYYGFIKNLVVNVETVALLAKLAGKGIKVGSKKLVNFACFWCATEAVEDKTSTVLHAASTAVASWWEKFTEKPVETMKQSIKGMLNSIANTIGDGIKDSFGCAKWSQSRYKDIGLDIGISEGEYAQCEEPVFSLKCATCSQKINMICGSAGFLSGEAFIALLTGGTLTLSSKVSRSIQALSVTKKTKSTLNSIETLNKGKELLSTATKSVLHAGGTVNVVARIALDAGISILKIASGYVLKIGEKLIPLSKVNKARLLTALSAVNNTVSGGLKLLGKGVEYASYPVRAYLELLEKAYILGRRGSTGLAEYNANKLAIASDSKLTSGGTTTPASKNKTKKAIEPQVLPKSIDDASKHWLGIIPVNYKVDIKDTASIQRYFKDIIKQKGTKFFNENIALHLKNNSLRTNAKLAKEGFLETDNLVIGGGIHGSVSARGMREAFPDESILVVERFDCFGVFDCLGDTFYINSAEFLNKTGKEVAKASKNKMAGMPLQPYDFDGLKDLSLKVNDEFYIPGKTLGNTSKANILSSGADILSEQKIKSIVRAPSGSKYKYEVFLESGEMVRTNKVVVSTGLGDPTFPIKDKASLELLTKEVAMPESNIWMVENFLRTRQLKAVRGQNTLADVSGKRVAVIGGGDGGNITAEYLLGKGPSTGYSGPVSATDLPDRVFWFGQKNPDEASYVANTWERYHDISPHFPNGSAKEIIEPVNSYCVKVVKLDNNKFALYGDKLNEPIIVDEVIFSAGYSNNIDEILVDFTNPTGDLMTVPFKVKSTDEVVARQVDEEDIYMVGPTAQYIEKGKPGLGTTEAHAGGKNTPRIEDLTPKTYQFSSGLE